jgi:site-specific recombinase XerD
VTLQLTQIKAKYRPKAARLMDQVREVLRYHHYAYRTEQAYLKWIVQFIRFNGRRHPKELGKADIERFLSHLACNRNVAAATQNQALNAIVFLYKHVLDVSMEEKIEAVRSRKPKQLPTVLSREEVRCLLRSCFKTYCAWHSGVARLALPALVTFLKQLLRGAFRPIGR